MLLVIVMDFLSRLMDKAIKGGYLTDFTIGNSMDGSLYALYEWYLDILCRWPPTKSITWDMFSLGSKSSLD